MAFLSPDKILSAPTFLPGGQPDLRLPRMPQDSNIAAETSSETTVNIFLISQALVSEETSVACSYQPA